MNIEVNERGRGRKTMHKAFSYLPFLLVRVCFYIGRGEINKSHQNQEITLQLPLVACSNSCI